MRFLYVTDLHGDRGLYEAAARTAVLEMATLVVNGGDMLPRQGDDDVLTNQRGFFDWLRRHLLELQAKGIAYFAMFGNDDCRVLLPELDSLAREGLLSRLDVGWIAHGGWQFAGFPWVPDTPFLLKDWSLLDSTDWKVPHQLGPAVVSTETGFAEVGFSSQFHLSRMETVEQKLGKAPYAEPPDPVRSIFVMHAPLARSKLDTCWDGREVGSEAGRSYIERMNFPLSLHGHIHEAPATNGGIWAARVGGTLAVNPGTGGGLCWLLVDTESRTLRHAIRGEAKF